MVHMKKRKIGCEHKYVESIHNHKRLGTKF